MTTINLMPISSANGWKAISDDDLCASCTHCGYNPGSLSLCKKDWPGLVDADGYVQQCKSMTSSKPIKTDRVFADAEGMLGVLWSQFCFVENELAEMLHSLPLGTAVVLDGDVWVLRDDGACLVLVHGNYADGEITDEVSRFDFDLSWIDVSEDELQSYIERVQKAMSSFNTVNVSAN